MPAITPEEIQQLARPFAPHEHFIREGGKTKNGQKTQWFVYVDRVAVQRRLDELFPGEWEFRPIREHRTDDYVSIVAEMSIRGITRGYNGGASIRRDDDDLDEDIEKGAMTDTFRRVATMWGIGLYLYNAVPIWVATYERGNWDAARAAKNEAFTQFARWYKQVFGDDRASLNTPRPAPHPAADDPFRVVTPHTEPPKTETGEFVATFVERRKASTPGKDGNDRYFYTVSDGDGGKANTFTREPFSAAGVQCDTWELMEVGQTSTITPPVKVTYEVKQLGGGRTVNNVVSVGSSGAGETVPF